MGHEINMLFQMIPFMAIQISLFFGNINAQICLDDKKLWFYISLLVPHSKKHEYSFSSNLLDF